ncbi:LysE family translocator [Sagittula salina]|uniref:LysE family translocator n=1 Tax=Sagittula salina TaxID=2820268 RepID=A0A940S332_9RHOB|nr:LysE family translocator [Sagittula salina]MBP0482614.1 LysE family translocator [Sagittula salina]
MTHDLLLALAGFAAATLFTPGPNNLMLVTSGANFGLRRSMPHLSGVALGFPLMILPVGLGAMRAFEAFPPLYTILKAAAVVYMLYLAWKIATAGAVGQADAGAQPLSFVQAAAFQWVNPKGWSMALGAITLYAPGHDVAGVLWIAVTFLALGTLSALTWTGFGTGIRRWLADPVRLTWFNRGMALLLVAAMVPVLGAL